MALPAAKPCRIQGWLTPYGHTVMACLVVSCAPAEHSGVGSSDRAGYPCPRRDPSNPQLIPVTRDELAGVMVLPVGNTSKASVEGSIAPARAFLLKLL